MSESVKFSFPGKKILVTGGGKGLGKAIIQKLTETGACVYTIEKDESLVKSLVQEFPGITAKTGDLTDWKQTDKIVQEFGAMDHLVNNAGVCLLGEFLGVGEEEFDAVSNINIKALFGVTQSVARLMIREKKQGCTIVNIASVCGLFTLSKNISVYSLTKSAVISLTKSLATELGSYSIRVNAICPTAINTDLHLETVKRITEGGNESFYRGPLKGRSYALEGSEVADSVCYLVSVLFWMGGLLFVKRGFINVHI